MSACPSRPPPHACPQARELKSVYVNADARFLRLLLHEHHQNPHNTKNQVALIAVNVLGTVMSDSSRAALRPGVQPPGGCRVGVAVAPAAQL